MIRPATQRPRIRGRPLPCSPTRPPSIIWPPAPRTYDLYASTPSSSGYSVQGNLDSGLTLTTPASYLPASSLGSGWSFLGQITLDSSSSLVVNYSGGSPATAISLLQPTSTTVYDGQENPLTQTDAMGTLSASTYDNLGRPLAASQGQAVNVASGARQPSPTCRRPPAKPGRTPSSSNRPRPPAVTPSRKTARASFPGPPMFPRPRPWGARLAAGTSWEW